jgi:hypothetical protein
MAPKLRSFIDFLAERLGSSEKGSQRPRPKREQLSNR